MYIMITGITGEKRTNLAYPIWGKEVVVISTFSDNINNEFTKPWTLDFGSISKQITAGTYMR